MYPWSISKRARCYFKHIKRLQRFKINIETCHSIICLWLCVTWYTEFITFSLPKKYWNARWKWRITIGGFKVLHFSMKKLVQGVHIIHPARNQSYHCLWLHKNPHYGIKTKYVPLFIWIVKTMGIPFQEYMASEGEHKNDFLTIINNLSYHTLILQQIYDAVKTCKMRSRNLSNFSFLLDFQRYIARLEVHLCWQHQLTQNPVRKSRAHFHTSAIRIIWKLEGTVQSHCTWFR